MQQAVIASSAGTIIEKQSTSRLLAIIEKDRNRDYLLPNFSILLEMFFFINDAGLVYFAL